jgi:hypothetical protein
VFGQIWPIVVEEPRESSNPSSSLPFLLHFITHMRFKKVGIAKPQCEASKCGPQNHVTAYGFIQEFEFE